MIMEITMKKKSSNIINAMDNNNKYTVITTLAEVSKTYYKYCQHNRKSCNTAETRDLFKGNKNTLRVINYVQKKTTVIIFDAGNGSQHNSLDC